MEFRQMDTSRVLLTALIGLGLVIVIRRVSSFVYKGWRARALVIRLQKLGKVSCWCIIPYSTMSVLYRRKESC